jgi:RepB DNA-primase from phage plasmid
MRRLYVMHDSDEELKSKGCRMVADEAAAASANRKGYGVFWTVNSFKIGVRRIAELERIDAWAVDLDTGSKGDMRAKINSSPLEPSLIVETARGYHCWFRAKDGAIPAHWNALVLDRLVPFFGADKNARDIARILRAPGYLHLKDPTKPFAVVVVHERNVTYSEEQVARAFPALIRPGEKPKSKESRPVTGETIWDRIYNLDCEEALTRIGGSLGQSYEFKKTSRGNKNIFVDGKGTSCWIDSHGRIGSLSHGGPTVIQWCAWLGYSKRDALELVKRAYPGIDHE